MVGMMNPRKRVYDAMLERHFAGVRQMAFLSGPRQVGKSTTGRKASDLLLNWDDPDDRRILLRGPSAVAEWARLDRVRDKLPVLALDELHKFRRWKGFLKGFFDTYGDRVRVAVTGSSRLDIFRRGGDSLMGRYFPFRMHPFSIAEIASPVLPDERRILRSPASIPAKEFDALWAHGGFPEPFLQRADSFSRRWRRLRREQLVREDIRDMTRVQEIDQLDSLLRILEERSGSQVNFSSLAGEIGVSVDTIRRWMATLQSFFSGFLVRPWYRNVARSLRKEPKWYLRDWSGIDDEGARFETFVACHLLKAVEGWSDLGWGDFELCYLRDKDRREVDFVVVRDRKPWFLVEAKVADERPHAALSYFQAMTGAPHAFQAVLQGDETAADAFGQRHGPATVSARSFMSQLI
jgi:hypothetical protein